MINDSALNSTAHAQPEARRGMSMSMRSKGLMVFFVLIAYSILIAVFAFHEKNLLLEEFAQIQTTLETETILKQAEVSSFHAVMTILSSIDKPDYSGSLDLIQLHYQTVRDAQKQLATRLPGDTLNITQLTQAWNNLGEKMNRENLNRLSIEFIKTKDDIAVLLEKLQENREALSDHYRSQSDSVAITTFLLGFLGLGLLGALTGLFFRRMTDDLRLLQHRALAIVSGFRGEPLAITRHDEVGQLMEAVNDMALALDQRENELMLERQKYFHQEKMAAIGTLAAGVAHEIGNPIAAISGIAEAMMEQRADGGRGCRSSDCLRCQPDLIVEQTKRLSAITREISEFASPEALEPEFLDLNQLLKSTCNLIRYDKRLNGVTLELNLDGQLNALYGVADQLTQLVMNLLINAMDALDNVKDRKPTVTIRTATVNERISLSITDNGHGIPANILHRLFDAFFTTKPAGKGTGLGLSLCYSITQKHGGTIDINSTVGVGTTVNVCFPITAPVFDEVTVL